MDYAYYGWGYFFFPILFFFLLFGLLAWRPGRWNYRGRGRDDYYDPYYRSGYPDYPSWGYPYEGAPWERRESRGKGPKGYRRSDEKIREDVNDRLSIGYLDASDIEVACSGGHLVLTGTVGSRREKRLAENIADSVPGVLDVANRLEIGKVGATTPAAA